MANFKDHKLTVTDILSVIPDEIMSHISAHTGVDYYTKVLHGKKLFYLLLYGILENDRLSQRTLEDTFNDSVFKTLFNLDPNERIRRSSLSERLGKIDPAYFRRIYECIYEQFSDIYSPVEREKHNLIRVDSTIVRDLSGRMAEGFHQTQSPSKSVKFGVAFDGMFPCEGKLFTSSEYVSENKALPQVVLAHAGQGSGYSEIYLLDRGLYSTDRMSDFCGEQITFIVRSKEKRKYVELSSLIGRDTDKDLGSLTLLRDSKVRLYTSTPVRSKSGKVSRRQELVEQPFRLLVAARKDDPTVELWFVTNAFDMAAKDITDAYRRRWDIEVFFRFIKQELNTSHLVSFNRNGMEVMLYMSLIVSMLVLIYKRANNIGYKTAKRRMAMEIRDLAIAMIIVQCGGDPNLFFKT